MKTAKKWLALCLALTVCCLASCSRKEPVMEYGSGVLDEADYAYLMSYVKSVYNENFKYYGYEQDINEFLDEPYSEEQTLAEFLTGQIDDTAKLMLVVEQLCREAGISVTDPSVVSEINEAMQEIEDNLGGKDAMAIELAKLGYTRGSLERYEYFNALYTLLRDYRYGEDGVAKIAESDVRAAFEKQYVKMEAYQFQLVGQSSDGTYTNFTHDFASDYEKSEVVDYMLQNFLKVGYLSFAEQTDAEDALAKLSSGEATMDDYKSVCEQYYESYLVSEKKATSTIYAHLADADPGTWLLEDAEEGWLVLYRDEISAEDLTEDAEKEVRAAMVTAEAEKYFRENFVTVGHILYEKEEDAKAVLDGIKAGETTFAEHETDTKDSGVEYTFSYGEMVEEFEKAAFALEEGEYCIAQTTYGFHLIERRALKEDAFNEEDAVVAMSRQYLMELADQMFEDMKAGKADFADPGEDAEYSYLAPSVYEKAGLNAELLELLENAGTGEFVMWEVGSSGAMILRLSALTDEDLKEQYETVEDDLIYEAFNDYLTGFFDSVKVNAGVHDRFDIHTAKCMNI